MNHSDIKNAVSKILNDPLVGKGTFSVEDLIADAIMRLKNAAVVPVKRGRPPVKNTKKASPAVLQRASVRDIFNELTATTPSNGTGSADQS